MSRDIEEEHLAAVRDAVKAISAVMRDRKTPLAAGLNAMVMIASKLIVVMSETEEEARRTASAACDTLNKSVANEYSEDRAEFLAFRNKQ